MTQQCSNCRFWVEGKPRFFGKISSCRRFPPHPIGYPEAGAADWCGEWQARLGGMELTAEKAVDIYRLN